MLNRIYGRRGYLRKTLSHLANRRADGSRAYCIRAESSVDLYLSRN
jgi:hypothetical protein